MYSIKSLKKNQSTIIVSQTKAKVLLPWASARGGRGGPWPPPGFSHTLSKSSQISKILPFLVVNTGSILIGPPENFSADALGCYIAKMEKILSDKTAFMRVNKDNNISNLKKFQNFLHRQKKNKI